MLREPPRPVDLRIRPATVADAESVAITHVASWRAGYAGQLPDEFLAGLSVEARTSSWEKVFAGPGIEGGVGSTLHAAAMTDLRARGFSGATLWVLTTNARARGFYERRGWLPDDETKLEWRGDVRLDEMRYRLGTINAEARK